MEDSSIVTKDMSMDHKEDIPLLEGWEEEKECQMRQVGRHSLTRDKESIETLV